MSAATLLAAVRAEMGDLLTKRAAATTALDAVRSDESSTPEAITTATQARDAFDGQIDALIVRETELAAEVLREDAMSELQNRVTPTGAPRGPPAANRTVPVGDGVIVREARTYSQLTNQRDKQSWFQDAYRATVKFDDSARRRLERHAEEVRVDQPDQYERATTTGSFAGLVVPQYLTDMAAPLLRFGRPLANACNRHELPERGMALIIPRATTGTSTAIQATQNTAVSNTDMVVTDLTVPVVTIAGQQDVARQALERGEQVDSFVYLDLARAHAANVDNQVINGSGSAGQMLGVVNTGGINAATAYGAAITPTLFNLKVAGQITAVTSAGAGIWAKCLVMHPRRWGWLLGQVDSTGRPIVTANNIANFNALANITEPGKISADTSSDGVVGFNFVGIHSSGLPVLTDLNMPTAVGAATGGEDLVFASDLAEYHLWEEANGLPKELKFEQTTGGSLTTKLVIYSYAAFTAGRYPAATGKIGGLDTTTNGQVAPAF